MDAPWLRISGVLYGLRSPGAARRGIGRLALVLAVVGAALMGTDAARFPFEASPASPLGFVAMMVAALLSGAYAVMMLDAESPGPVATGATLTVERGILMLEGITGTETIALADVEAGWEDTEGRAVFRLRGGRELTVDAGSGAAGGLLHAAGALQRAARVPVGSALAEIPAGRAFGWLGLAVALPAALGFVARIGADLVSLARGTVGAAELAAHGLAAGAALLGVGFLLRLLAPRSAVVGTDGIAVEGVLGRRFLPFTEIDDVVVEGDGVRVVRERGLLRRIWLQVVPGGEGLHPRIRAAFEARNGAPPVPLARLDRRGRPLAAWIGELARLADTSGSSYRQSSLLPEQLAAVVEDPAELPERRLAAAVAVGASGDQAAQGRVRVAAQASADDDLRAALEQAAEGEAVAAALERASRRG